MRRLAALLALVLALMALPAYAAPIDATDAVTDVRDDGSGCRYPDPTGADYGDITAR